MGKGGIMDLNKFTQKAQQAVVSAQGLARDYGHQTIEPAHLLLALLNQTESTVPAVISQIAGSTEVLRQEVQKDLAARPKVYGADTGDPDFLAQLLMPWTRLNVMPKAWAMNILRPSTFCLA
jgi:ATP-dependent Clp protease ATP-binding subunit ClpB